MIEELLKELRNEVGETTNLSESTKTALLEHVAAMEVCAGKTDRAAKDDSESDAIISDPNGEVYPLKGLDTLIEDLEISHPRITTLVNRIATALGNIGI